MTDIWPRLSRQPWIWSFIAMIAVWLATVIFTQGQGAGDILTAALSFAAFTIIIGLGQMMVITTGPGNVDLSIPATITLSGISVAFPAGGFLQATEDGENALVECVREAVGHSKAIADLFAGLGTFALATWAAYAAEASRDTTAALKRAAPPITVEHRDLYRRPLDTRELSRFDAVVLDPPRAGAAQQVAQLAASAVPRIAYVSCNPATFSRDAKMLVDGGYTLEWVRPVGQFRWSTHVELAACFTR